MLKKLLSKASPLPQPFRIFAGPDEPSRPAKQSDVDQMYQPLPSFTDLLPWVEYLEDEQAILLNDGISVGAAFTVNTVATEGRSEEWLDAIRDSIEDALQDSFEEKETSPWVVQFYCQDTDDFREYLERLEQYIDPQIRQTEYTQRFLAQTRRHMQSVAKEGGLFNDEMVTKTPWRGSIRKVRMIIYRWIPRSERVGLYDMSPLEALNIACSRLSASLSGIEIHLRKV